MVTDFTVRHPTLLARLGYGVHYSYAAPDAEVVSFSRASPQAEFEEIAIQAAAGEIREIRFTKASDPFALIVHVIAGTLTGTWDAPAGEPRAPLLPPNEEVRRRFALASEGFSVTREALGLKDFRGRDGAVTLQLAGVEDLTVRARFPDADYDYKVFALAQETMVEELTVQAGPAAMVIEVAAGRLTIERQSTTPDGQRTFAVLMLEGGTWSGTIETRRPGAPPGRQDLTRGEADQIFNEALGHLRAARARFGIGFGRDLAAFRIS